MDDLYQNAWSDSAEPSHAAFASGPSPSWPSQSKLTTSFGEEADLAAPSWATGAGLRWDEPGSPGFSWAQSEQDAGWGSSTYEGITLGKLSPQEHAARDLEEETHFDAAGPAEGVAAPSTPSPQFQPLPSSPPPPTTPTPPPQPTLTHVYEIDVGPVEPTPPSPDAFGSFASGLSEDTVPSPAFAVNTTESDPWGSAWADAKPQQEEEPPDEWERAKQEKAKQDRRVVRGLSLGLNAT